MKLGVSNLAWAPGADDAARDLLRGLGVTAIEAAPTRIAPWEDLSSPVLHEYRDRWADAGLAVASLQAIFFNRPEAQLLGDAPQFAAMGEHLRLVAEAGAALGARVAVFGAPRNRNRGERELAQAETLAAERLHRLGGIASASGLTLGIEPVPPGYGSDMMTRAEDVLRVVAMCGHPNIRPHLDTACVGMGGGDIAAAIAAAGPALCHYHAAEPGLGPFDAPSPEHVRAAASLRQIGYGGYVVIEMRQGEGDGLAALAQAVRYVAAAYAGVGDQPTGTSR